ncbi:MAG: hypothetical protein K6B74_05210 [Ruminococcus sp.]|nr:hypothetical protein [Ruminococcus sp.]
MMKEDIIYLAAVSALIVVCYIIRWAGLTEKFRLFRLFGLLPVVGTLVGIFKTDWDPCLVPAYLGTLLFSLSVVSDSVKKFLPAAVTSFLMTIAAIPLCMTSEFYRKPPYEDDFNVMYGQMKKYYILTDYKQTDFDAIYDKYITQIKELPRKSNDRYFTLVYQFCNEFNDLHVAAGDIESRDYQNDMKNIQAELCGGDPGFTGIRLDDGRVLACCVSPDSEAYKAGLRNGCEITAYEGKPVDEFLAESRPEYMAFADIDNVEFCKPLMCFGITDGKAELVFKNESGSEVTAEIAPSGNYSDRIRSAMKLLFGEYDDKNNYQLEDLGGGFARLEINSFMDSPLFLMKRHKEEMEEYGDNQWEFWEQYTDKGIHEPMIYLAMKDLMEDMKAAGTDKLIIDLRQNGGGELSKAGYVAGWFTDKPLFFATEEYTNRTTGRTVVTEPEKTESAFGDFDGEVVILVGPETVSAAEIFSRTMQKLPNVTVMGLTDTAGSAMGVGASRTALLKYQFPMYKMLDEDGNILIDSGADMQGGLERDVKIPFDEKAFDAVFIDNADYAVDYAVEYLKTH